MNLLQWTGALRYRGGMRRSFETTVPAQWFYMPAVVGARLGILSSVPQRLPLQSLPTSDLCDYWHTLSFPQSALGAVVSCHLSDGLRQGKLVAVPQLYKQNGTFWNTAHQILPKMRPAMVDRDTIYCLGGWVELDDAFVDGRRSGVESRRAEEGTTPILVAIESRDKKAGFMAMETIPSVSLELSVSSFSVICSPGRLTRTDGLMALCVLGETQHNEGCVTPPEQVDEWLPWVHIVIGNLKAFLLGTYHGVSGKYLQEHLDEFVYRINRRVWEPGLPLRLINTRIDRTPARLVAEKG